MPSLQAQTRDLPIGKHNAVSTFFRSSFGAHSAKELVWSKEGRIKYEAAGYLEAAFKQGDGQVEANSLGGLRLRPIPLREA